MPGRMKKKREDLEIDARIAAKKEEVKNPLEKKIEDTVRRYGKTKNIESRKYTSPNYRAVPDGIFFPGQGRTFFIEFKRLGKRPTKSQEREIRRLEDLGFVVYVVDTIKEGKRIMDLWAS